MRSITGRLLETLQTCFLDLPDLIIDEPSAFHVATQFSHCVGRDRLALRRTQTVKALGGPFQLGIEAADAEPNQCGLHSVDDTASLSDQAVTLAVGSLGILVLYCRDRDHLAVITLAAQPAENSAFEQLSVETIGLGAPVFARYRYARCMDDVGLDATRLEPARQPEAVTAGLEGDYNAFNSATSFLRFLPPPMQQLQQCALVYRKLLQRLALDARHDAGNEPAQTGSSR